MKKLLFSALCIFFLAVGTNLFAESQSEKSGTASTQKQDDEEEGEVEAAKTELNLHQFIVHQANPNVLADQDDTDDDTSKKD